MVDLNKEYADFMNKRQERIDAERAKNAIADERTEYGNGFNNPPAVRGTDGLPPGEPEQNPIEMAAKIDAGESVNGPEENDGPVTAASTIPQIKAFLDAQNIAYDPAAKKPDLVKLLPAQ